MLHLHPSFIYINPRRLRPEKTNTVDMYFHKKEFLAKLDFRDINPREVKVKTSGSTNITVIALYSDQKNELPTDSMVVRNIFLPNVYDRDLVTATFTKNGILTIHAPRRKNDGDVPLDVFS